jgi:hypothetical protein
MSTIDLAGASRGRRLEEPERISDFLDEVLDQWELSISHVRWNVTRIGEREPIASHVRAAIWYRDQGRCADCLPEYPRSDVLHLDHIIPWSAGGRDTSENLRMLCEVHNVERSNFIDMARQKTPVTWWCHRCYSDEAAWEYYSGFAFCPIHPSSSSHDGGKCRVARAYAKAAMAGTPATWHQRQPLSSFPHTAYCAHCDAPGLTGVLP